MPTMMAMGVASPRAQGQAMMSTATALTSACGRAGAGPKMSQAMKVMKRGADNGGNKDGGNLVGQMLNGSTATLRLPDQADDLGKHGLTADALGSHQDGAVAVDAGADDAVAGMLFDGDGFAGNQRLIDHRAAFEHEAIDGNLFAGADAQ